MPAEVWSAVITAGAAVVAVLLSTLISRRAGARLERLLDLAAKAPEGEVKRSLLQLAEMETLRVAPQLVAPRYLLPALYTFVVLMIFRFAVALVLTIGGGNIGYNLGYYIGYLQRRQREYNPDLSDRQVLIVSLLDATLNAINVLALAGVVIGLLRIRALLKRHKEHFGEQEPQPELKSPEQRPKPPVALQSSGPMTYLWLTLSLWLALRRRSRAPRQASDRST